MEIVYRNRLRLWILLVMIVIYRCHYVNIVSKFYDSFLIIVSIGYLYLKINFLNDLLLLNVYIKYFLDIGNLFNLTRCGHKELKQW